MKLIKIVELKEGLLEFAIDVMEEVHDTFVAEYERSTGGAAKSRASWC